MMRVAPETQYKGDFNSDVWLLNLDMIEQNTGIVIDKVMVSIDTVKGSVFTFDKDYVLYSKLRPYLNKVVLPDDRGFATSELIPLKPDINLLNRVFLACLLRSDQFVEYATKLSGGSRMPRVPMKEFRNFPCILPPINLQNQFAAFVQQVDKSKFVCYSNFKSQFIEMFGLPIDNVKCFKKGTIREVVSEVKYGTSKPATIGGKYPYLRMNNITYEGQLDLTDLKFIDIPDKEIEKCVVRKGDVLFNRTNSKELVGKTCVFNIDTPMVIAGYIIRVKVNEKVIPEYLSTFLNLKYSKNILFEMCKAAIGQANINAQELQDIEIIIPPMSLQLKFLDLLHQTDKSKLSEHVTYNSLGDMLVNLNLFRR
ncbi:restriction endonuclease subunit S [Schinkia azotoformans]|uniref:restriction endonuclease subunit S n=4 Tax=Schinkia azotoformans TaxID=1454 RepID=UPI002DBE82D3|nr:restriction endonuclease subunit S [Schinkia azotoformans]MEC1695074.1 restriction endonuclease subunit S [Schinkia azotoformans]